MYNVAISMVRVIEAYMNEICQYANCELIDSYRIIEIEKHIKELSEQELRDDTIVKVILRHCFDDKEEISEMAKGHSLDKLVEKVMELIREVYL